MTASPIAVELTRRDVLGGRDVVESTHQVRLVVVDGDGAVLAAAGDVERPVYPRSAVKPFQAAACLRLLGADAAGLGEEELAVSWASHRAEPRHRAVVQQLLARSATRAEDLTCPPAPGEATPADAPTRLAHNCSGKHALFALAGRAVGCAHERLLDPRGPLQRELLAGMAGALGEPLGIAVDGCGAPAVLVPLRALAAGFARLLTDDVYAPIVTAGHAHPDLVGGEGRLESALLRSGVLAKPGAEGIFAAAWRRPDGRVRACAIKAEDGAGRAADAVMHALAVGAGLAVGWSPPPPLGGGQPQGEVRVSPAVAAHATV